MTPADFLKLLQNHDWYYMYSDDHSVWRRGQAGSEAISRAKKDDPVLQELYNDYYEKNVK